MSLAYIDALRVPKLDPVTTQQGGTAHKVDCWTRLRRFLILGSEGGSYYSSARDLTVENVGVVKECLDTNDIYTIEQIVEVSHGGLAPKNEPAILALAMATLHEKEFTRSYAWDKLRSVCRTGTHLLHFAAYRKALGGKGMGRAYRRAIREWFSRDDIAYQAVKYPSRDGWALADLLRMAHPKLGDKESIVASYLLEQGVVGEPFLYAAGCARFGSLFPESVATAIREFGLPRETLNTKYLNDPAVWEALLEKMPMTAMIRNLGKMTNVGLIAPGSAAESTVRERLESTGWLRQARVHPLSLLTALGVYQQGKGDKGSLTWTPSKKVVSALDEAFYLAFGNVTPTGKRINIGLDISPSMFGAEIVGSPLNAASAMAAMALVTMNVEKNVVVRGYANHIIDIPIYPSMRLDEVLRVVESHRRQYGGTDPNLLFQTAAYYSEDYDAFVTYTDNQTGNRTAAWTALEQYRAKRVKNARHAVVASSANSFSMANPDDPKQLDVVGWDLSTPQVLSGFISGAF